MKIQDNYSITKLFCGKKITIYVDSRSFYITLPSVRMFFEQEEWSQAYQLWTASIDKIKKLGISKIQNSFDLLISMLFFYGQFKQYRKLVQQMRSVLEQLIPDIEVDIKNKQLKINNIIINNEIWNYIIYLLKLSNGEKANKPLTFSSEEGRLFFEAQQKLEDKIKKVKNTKETDTDNLLKMFLFISYSFPSLTFDYLFNQTMAQIQWLYKYAAGAVNYEVNAQAMAAGNMKKGKKLDFFIK